MRDVDAEAVDAAVEPEAQDRLELVADLGVAPVEVGLGGVEEVEVPLAVRRRRVQAGPPKIETQLFGGSAPSRPRAVAEHVAVARRAARAGGERLPEPRVLGRGVVGHDVDDHLDAELVGRRQHRVEVGERAEQRVDVAVVGDVVAVVVLGRGVERRDPDARRRRGRRGRAAAARCRPGRRCRRRRRRRSCGRRSGSRRRAATTGSGRCLHDPIARRTSQPGPSVGGAVDGPASAEGGRVDLDPGVLGARRRPGRRRRTACAAVNDLRPSRPGAGRPRRAARRRPAARRPGPSSGPARTGGPRGPPTSRRRSPARPRWPAAGRAGRRRQVRRSRRARAAGPTATRRSRGRPPTGPGKIRSPSPSARSGPQAKQVGEGVVAAARGTTPRPRRPRPVATVDRLQLVVDDPGLGHRRRRRPHVSGPRPSSASVTVARPRSSSGGGRRSVTSTAGRAPRSA